MPSIAKPATKRRVRVATIPVSEKNLRDSARRLLSNRQIVWNEIFYIQNKLAARATPAEIDECVVSTRGLSWEELTTGN